MWSMFFRWCRVLREDNELFLRPGCACCNFVGVPSWLVGAKVCADLKTRSQNHKKKLTEAKALVYLKGFTDGASNIRPYLGQTVRDTQLCHYCPLCLLVGRTSSRLLRQVMWSGEKPDLKSDAVYQVGGVFLVQFRIGHMRLIC